MIVGVAGNRPYSPDVDPAQRRYARDKVHGGIDYFAGRHCDEVICDLAMGPGQWAAIGALRNRMRLHVALPFPAQHHARRWSAEAREQYDSLLAAAHYTWVARPHGGFDFTGYAAQRAYVVRRSDELLIVTQGRSRGGTWEFVRLAAQHDKPGWLIHTRRRAVVRFTNRNELAAAVGWRLHELLPTEEAA